MENKINKKPTGQMPVVPPGGRAPKRQKSSIFGPASLTALAVMGVAVLLIRFVYAANAGDKPVEIPEVPESETEEAAYLTGDDIRGIWSVVDCVENAGDFDPKDPKFLQRGVKLSYYRAEFFDDGTATVKTANSNVSVCNWVTGEELGILSGIAELVVVREIQNIDGKDYMFVDFAKTDFMPEGQGIYVFARNKPKYVYPGDDVRGKDLRNYDFSAVGDNLQNVSFDERTVFPQAATKAARETLERGENPGLGVRALHEAGITGKGINVALIDEPLDVGHPEYRDKIVEYRDFGSGADTSAQGCGVAGILAGENMGVAPGVNIYYAAVPAWEMYDAQYYASALDWIVEVNRSLPEGEKIKVACISPNPENPLPWINVDKYLASFMRAEKEGIIVLDSTDEHGLVFGACSLDYANPEDVSLCKPKGAYRIQIAPYHYDGEAKEIYSGEEPNENMLRAPITHKTLPETTRPNEHRYRHDSKGQLSWALPYAAGVLALGWQVRPELGGDEMARILFDTAYTDKSGNKYISPGAFIEYLKN